MIPFLRVYNASIYNYLKYQVLPVHFTEEILNEPLVLDSESNSYVTNSSMLPLPTSEGRGWSLFDEVQVNGRIVEDLSAEQSSKVTVNGASSYDIDYVNGRIINPNTVPSSVSYSWNYVSLVQGWPGETPPPLPVVALSLAASNKAGFQLGGGSKDTITGDIHIFATSEQEKQDITDVLYQSLYNRTLTIGNWHEGSYLDYDGTFTGFTPSAVPGLSSGVFEDVTSNLVRARFDWSELNRYRSYISFKFSVYKDD
jgi:hypothetical protein